MARATSECLSYSSNHCFHVLSSGPMVKRLPLRTSGTLSNSGSSLSLSNHRSSESCAYRKPSSPNLLDSLSRREAVPNFCANLLSTPRDAGLSIRSTKWVLIRRSEKNRSAFRVSALFLIPKIWTSKAHSPRRNTAKISHSTPVCLVT
jgi:hypothetical protein